MDRIKIQLQGRDFGRDLFLFYFQIFVISFDFDSIATFFIYLKYRLDCSVSAEIESPYQHAHDMRSQRRSIKVIKRG